MAAAPKKKTTAPLSPAQVQGAIDMTKAHMRTYVGIPGKVQALYDTPEGQHPKVRKVMDAEYLRYAGTPFVPKTKRPKK